MVVYPDQTAPAVSAICDRLARRNQKVIYIGFGRDGRENESSKGIKRYGNNVIESASEGLIYSMGKSQATNNDGQDATIASGDSGGPLFDATQECILGVASGANDSDSFHANVVTPGFDWVDFIIEQRPDLQDSVGADPDFLQSASRSTSADSDRNESRFSFGW